MVNALNLEQRLDALREFADVFEPSMGCIGHMYFKDGAQLKLNKARLVPYAYCPLVEVELA